MQLKSYNNNLKSIAVKNLESSVSLIQELKGNCSHEVNILREHIVHWLGEFLKVYNKPDSQWQGFLLMQAIGSINALSCSLSCTDKTNKKIYDEAMECSSKVISYIKSVERKKHDNNELIKDKYVAMERDRRAQFGIINNSLWSND